MSTLYRDYRPNNFSEVFGQNHIKIALQNEIASGKIPHAYLFCGPRAVGKTTLARVLAKSLNCLKRKESESEPCNTCASCQSISSGANLDIIEIDAASNTGVDNVRENIIASVRIAPSSASYRVFIIDEVHMLSISAWNALLKTLEEPPRNVVFVLCTTEVHKVPGTIISRCERFDFKRISVSDIVSKLKNITIKEKAEIDSEVLEAIARQADGHLRDAESLLGQVLSLGDGKITWEQAELIIPKHHHNEIIDLLELIAKKDASAAIKLVNTSVNSGLNLKNFLGEGIVVLRKILLNKANPGLAESLGLDLGSSLEMKILELSNGLDNEKIITYLEAFLSLYHNHNNSFIAQLPLEMKIVELCLTNKTVVLPPKAKIESLSVSQGLKKETPKDNPEPKANYDLNYNLAAAEVLTKWPEFLVRLKGANHSLSFILQNCRVEGVSDGKLALVFKYKFHRDRISDPNIKPLVEKSLLEVYGVCLGLNLIIDENLNLDDMNSMAPSSAAAENTETSEQKKSENNQEDNASADGLLNNLLQTFGGEVIN